MYTLGVKKHLVMAADSYHLKGPHVSMIAASTSALPIDTGTGSFVALLAFNLLNSFIAATKWRSELACS